jgi:hypothetical protein
MKKKTWFFLGHSLQGTRTQIQNQKNVKKSRKRHLTRTQTQNYRPIF